MLDHDTLTAAQLVLQYVFVFTLGAVWGSFLNVCAYRLPTERSVVWPGSFCLHCFQPVRWYDNIPLLSYWLLRGRCRSCKTPFSMRYFWVELLTGVSFLALFHLEIAQNWHGHAGLRPAPWGPPSGFAPLQSWAFFVHHALLFSLLLVASLCDLDDRQIPLSLTVTGTLLGLAAAVLYPWPFPNALPAALAGEHRLTPAYALPDGVEMTLGLYPWPVWWPLPAELAPGSPMLGLVTGLAGAAAGSLLLRAVGYLFTKGLGKEALGLGDADLMMMAGAFLGWQPVIMAFFAGAMVTLFLAVPQVLWRRLTRGDPDTSLPFGPGLAVGVVLTWLAMPAVNAEPAWRLLFFNAPLLAGMALAGALVIVAASFAMRSLRRGEG